MFASHCKSDDNIVSHVGMANSVSHSEVADNVAILKWLTLSRAKIANTSGWITVSYVGMANSASRFRMVNILVIIARLTMSAKLLTALFAALAVVAI
jgi:hypothetical protein